MLAEKAGANGMPPAGQPVTSKEELTSAAGVSLHGCQARARRRRPTRLGVRERGARAAVDVQAHFAERELRVFGELRGDLSRCGVRFQQALQLDDHARA